MSDCARGEQLKRLGSEIQIVGNTIGVAAGVIGLTSLATGPGAIVSVPVALSTSFAGFTYGIYGQFVSYWGEHYACQFTATVTVPIPPLPADGPDGGDEGGWNLPGSYDPNGVQICWEYRSGGGFTDGDGNWVVTASEWVRTIDPIVLDLDGNGIRYLTQPHSADYTGMDGRNEAISWISPGDGILVYDWNQDGVGQTAEWALTSFVNSARTDLEALRAFDSNLDGVFDASDETFLDFRIGIDANGDGLLGLGELHTLEAVGVASIDLTAHSHAHGAEIEPGVFLNESGAFTRSNGETGLFHSVGFETENSSQIVYSDSFVEIVSQGSANVFVARNDASIIVDMRSYTYAGYSFVDFFLGGGDDHLIGTDAGNVLSGGSGADEIYALGGNDFILADAEDILYGVVKGGSGTDVLQLTQSVGYAVYAHAHEVEAILGSDGDDILSGQGAAKVILDGGNGNDTLIGSSGDDVLVRSAGIADHLQGGAGDDLYLVQRASDEQSHSSDRSYISDNSGFDMVFLKDWSREQVDLQKDGDDLHLVLDDGSTLIFTGAFSNAGVDTVVFANSVEVSMSDLVRQANAEWAAQFPPVPAGIPTSDAFGSGPSAGAWESFEDFPRDAADINGDGRADIVGFANFGTFVALGQVTGGFGPVTQVSREFGRAQEAGGWASYDRSPRMLADVNGDGRADVVGFGEAGVYVGLAAEGGGFTPSIFASAEFGAGNSGWHSQDLYHRVLADVNGDGRADIVGFGDDGTYVALANADGTFGSAVLASGEFGRSFAAGGWGVQDRSPRMLADINGDNCADIVGFGEAGVYVALADGSGGFGSGALVANSFGASPSAGSWVSQERYPRMVADVNGDGFGDLIGFGELGSYYALADGNGGFGALTFGSDDFGAGADAGRWISNNRNPRIFADLDGNGLDEIIGFADNGIYVGSVDWFGAEPIM